MKTQKMARWFFFVVVLILFFLMILLLDQQAIAQKTGWVSKGNGKWVGKTNNIPQQIFSLVLITKKNSYQMSLTIHHPDSSVNILVRVYDNIKTNKKSFNVFINLIGNKKTKKLNNYTLNNYLFDRKQKDFLDLFPKSHPAFEFLLKKIKDGCGKITATKS